MKRCLWSQDSELCESYHDKEWGIPCHDDIKLFEYLTLEGMQAGLSWKTILNKREDIKKAFDNFNLDLIIKYDENKVEELLKNPNIIRCRRKIESVISNAKLFLRMQKEYKSFNNYIWSYVNYQPIVGLYINKELPSKNDLSIQISNDLKKLGFKYVGPTIIFSYLEAIGIMNNHEIDCFKYKL